MKHGFSPLISGSKASVFVDWHAVYAYKHPCIVCPFRQTPWLCLTAEYEPCAMFQAIFVNADIDFSGELDFTEFTNVM